MISREATSLHFSENPDETKRGGVKEYSKEVLDLLDKEIDRILVDDYGTEICSKISSLLKSGKKYRALLAILSYQAVNKRGELKKVMPLAVAIELIHNASLLHDDVIDEDLMRREELSFHNAYSKKEAIIIGDAMIALSVNICSGYGGRTVYLSSLYGFDLCAGEIMDIHNPSLSFRGSLNEEMYFLKIRKKSASLFRASMHLGALLGRGSSEEIEALSNFGEEFGLAYQLRDDVLDVKDEDLDYSDIKNGRFSMPLIHLYNHSNESFQEFLRDNSGNIKNRGDKEYNKEIIKKILEEIKRTKSIEYCKNEMMKKVNNAKNELQKIRDSEFREYLLEIPDLIFKE